jgi:hypothetical protein
VDVVCRLPEHRELWIMLVAATAASPGTDVDVVDVLA